MNDDEIVEYSSEEHRKLLARLMKQKLDEWGITHPKPPNLPLEMTLELHRKKELAS